MKALHIVAISCLIVGIILCSTALVLGGFDMAIFSTTKYTEGTENLSADFSNIHIETKECNIRLVATEETVCRAEYRHNIKTPLQFTVADGALTVKIDDQRKWYDYITFFNFGNSELTLYLPARDYSAVQLTTSTGSIDIPAGFTFTDVTAHATTGNITVDSVTTAGKLTAEVSTGYVKLTGISASTLCAKASTGRINLQDITLTGQMDIAATTGDVKVLRATAQTMTAKATTGDIVLQDVVLTGHMTLKTSTGHVRIATCDAETLDIETDTGDVRGTLRSPKIFIASTDTGRKNVPQTTTGGICRITCDTGDIDISIQ